MAGSNPPSLPGLDTAATSDPAIEALDLEPTARAAAYALKKAFPSTVFMSGRRDKADQARAMSGNVARNRQWIAQTYKKSDMRTQLQDWVDKHPEDTAKADIAAGLLSVFNAASSDTVASFSKHLTGDAFDVQPMVTDADAIKTAIANLPGLSWHTFMEGGIERWHAEF